MKCQNNLLRKILIVRFLHIELWIREKYFIEQDALEKTAKRVYDKVKECYIKGMGMSQRPCSIDAIYMGKDKKIYFSDVFTYTESEFERFILHMLEKE